MGFKCGTVGLPNVDKSTLFNSLTRAAIAAENYPFCTIDPHIGVVAVPDPRLGQLAELVRPEKQTPAHMEFVDFDEARYLEKLDIEKDQNGAYRIKR